MELEDDEMTVPTTTAANLPTIIMPSTAGKPVPSSEPIRRSARNLK